MWSMSDGEMLSSLDAAYAEIARLETFALHLIAGLETNGYAKEVGAGTTARLLSIRYRIDATKARRDVHLATTLPKYPAVAAALPEPDPRHTPADDIGEASEAEVNQGTAGIGVLLHPAQAEAIVSALEKVPTTVPADDLKVAEEQLVELGRTHSPLQLRAAGRQIRDRLDTDGPEPAEQKAYDRESLKLKKADNGVTFSGFLANENAELFRTLIHTHAKPHKTIDGALDPRSRDKRQADALTTVLTAANNPTATGSPSQRPTAAHTTEPADTGTGAAGASPRAGADDPADSLPGMPTGTDRAATTTTNGFIPGHGPKAHINVTIDFNDLKAATADKIGHLIYGDALSAATIRRLACDAQILPIVLGSDSQPVDVGTTVRLATGPMRKALIARDKGCVCCGAPPIYCDAHHVVSWIDGGETKITNLVLLCKRCHRDLHAGHWDIRIINGVVHVARPTWATPDPVPRGRYRPPATTPHPATPTPGTTTSGAPARAWPRDTDPPWITPDEAARLNPWGDALDEPPTHTQTRPPATDLDPWGDGERSIANADRRSKTETSSGGAFDPWGDHAPEHGGDAGKPRDGGPKLNRGTADPWRDAAQPRSTTTTAA